MLSKKTYYKRKKSLSESQTNLALFDKVESVCDYKSSLVKVVEPLNKVFLVENLALEYLSSDYKIYFDGTFIDTFVIHDCFIREIPSECHLSSFENLKNLILYNTHISEKVPPSFFDHRLLNTLKLRKNNICQLGKKTFENLSSLRTLDLSENFITEFTKNHCWEHNILQELNLSSNNLVVLKQSAFKKFEYLKTLDLSDNYLKKIHPKIFDKNSLIKLDVSKNSLQKLDSFRFLCKLGELENLNVSSNQIPFISQKLFANLSNLSELNVSDCQCENIDKKAFIHQVKLKCLKLSQNCLNGMDFSIFEKNLELQDLYLDNCGWKKIPIQLLASLKKLKCVSFNNIKYFLDDFNNHQLIQKISIENCDIDSLQIKNLENCTVLIELNMSNNNLKHLTNSMFTQTKTLKLLILKSCLIKTIGRDALKPFHDLKQLDLSRNLIKTCSEFLRNETLVELDLSFNEIQQLDYSFESLVALEKLQLQGNQLRKIKTCNFTNCIYLTYLDLSGNKIEEIESESFIKLLNLNELFLSNNRLKNLPVNLFHYKCSLDVLDLSSNSLVTLTCQVFDCIFELKKLLVNRNCLKEIEDMTLGDNPSLEYLDLSNNQLENIFEFLEKLVNLTYLNLSRNNLRILNNKSFFNLKKLEKLYLDEINICSVHEDLFCEQHQLKILSLKRNNLYEIKRTTFSQLWNLRQLNLSSNKLTNLDVSLFKGLKILSELKLKNNLIEYVSGDLLSSLSCLKKFDLSFNSFTMITSKNLFRNCKLLSELNLSNIKVEMFPKKFISYNCNLTKLDLSWNRLKELKHNYFKHLKYLDTLNLSYMELKILEAKHFEHLTFLENFFLQGNCFRKVSSSILDPLKNLKNIDVDNNVELPVLSDNVTITVHENLDMNKERAHKEPSPLKL